jgi:signal transduction histidine kinase
MRRLIDDLLALSLVSRSEMSWSRTSLRVCVADALELLNDRVAECTPTIAGADSLPPVRGDRKLLTQVFQHLLSNAMKFADALRPCVIDLSAEHDGSGWLIKTRDNGIGIPEQYLTKIFAPFQRLHGADKYPGSGMGLAICKRAIERHGGALWAVPNESVGSCFQFTLPDHHQ